jgi:hypothetical protein
LDTYDVFNESPADRRILAPGNAARASSASRKANSPLTITYHIPDQVFAGISEQRRWIFHGTHSSQITAWISPHFFHRLLPPVPRKMRKRSWFLTEIRDNEKANDQTKTTETQRKHKEIQRLLGPDDKQKGVEGNKAHRERKRVARPSAPVVK